MNERGERVLRAINITQDKLDESIKQEDSITKILVTRAARDIGIEHFKKQFDRNPEYNPETGTWI